MPNTSIHIFTRELSPRRADARLISAHARNYRGCRPIEVASAKQYCQGVHEQYFALERTERDHWDQIRWTSTFYGYAAHDDELQQQQHSNTQSGIAAVAAALCMHMKLTSRLLRPHLHHHRTYCYTGNNIHGANEEKKRKMAHNKNDMRYLNHRPWASSDRDLPDIPLYSFLVYVDRGWCVPIRRSRRLAYLDQETKTVPLPGRRREHGRDYPGRVGRDEQGEARRANTTPNEGPHLELERLSFITGSKSDYSIVETTWPTYPFLSIYIYIYTRMLTFVAVSPVPQRGVRPLLVYSIVIVNRFFEAVVVLSKRFRYDITISLSNDTNETFDTISYANVDIRGGTTCCAFHVENGDTNEKTAHPTIYLRSRYRINLWPICFVSGKASECRWPSRRYREGPWRMGEMFPTVAYALVQNLWYRCWSILPRREQ